MLSKKFIIPMVAIMSVASSVTVFASENPANDTTVIYKQAEVTAKSGLNVRKTPSIEKDNKLYAVPVGTQLGIVEKQEDWYKVKVNNANEAYIHSNYVKINNSNLYVNVDRLNFRENPGMDKKVYSVLTKGTKLEFVETSGDWIKVKFNNITGYVHSKYISNQKPVVTTESSIDKGTEKPNKNETTVETNKKPEYNSSNVESSKDESTINKEDNDAASKESSKNTNKVDKEDTKTSSTNDNSSSKSDSKTESKSESESNDSSKDKDVQALLDLAYAQIGKPYNWGAEGPSSFDCSGLMRYIFDNGGGVNLPRTSKAQSQYGTTVSRSNLKPGDLVFSSTDGSGTVSHVGVYVGDGQMIHAPKPGDVVKISSINSSYWNDAYLWAKRVM